MMRLFALFLVFGGSIGAEIAQTPPDSLSKIGLLPNEKAPSRLEPRERNPFAGKEAKTITPAVEDRVSEESILRLHLSQMKVTGLVRSESSNKALLSRLILKEGEILPNIMQGQTEKLRVGKITPEQVEIFFVENDERIEPRKIEIPIDLKPRVTQRWFVTDGNLPQNEPKPKP